MKTLTKSKTKDKERKRTKVTKHYFRTYNTYWTIDGSFRIHYQAAQCDCGQVELTEIERHRYA